jgi:hypothetical protein
LLQQLKNLTDPYAEEHQHLIEALKGMEKVAEHINEMQRIHEEYGAIFDHLFRQHQKSCKQPIDLSPGKHLFSFFSSKTDIHNCLNFVDLILFFKNIKNEFSLVIFTSMRSRFFPSFHPFSSEQHKTVFIRTCIHTLNQLSHQQTLAMKIAQTFRFNCLFR